MTGMLAGFILGLLICLGDSLLPSLSSFHSLSHSEQKSALFVHPCMGQFFFLFSQASAGSNIAVTGFYPVGGGGSFFPSSSSSPPPPPPQRFCDCTTTDQYASFCVTLYHFCIPTPCKIKKCMGLILQVSVYHLQKIFALSAGGGTFLSHTHPHALLNVQIFLPKQNFLDRTLTVSRNSSFELQFHNSCSEGFLEY